jgi:hypothetical protein
MAHLSEEDNLRYEMATFVLEHLKKKVILLLVPIKFLGAALLHRHNFLAICSEWSVLGPQNI